MKENKFIITEFLSASKPVNHKDVKLHISQRACSGLIFPVQGVLELSSQEHSVMVDKNHPVFVPAKMSYTNTCIEDAKSIMFNINVKNECDAFVPLFPINQTLLQNAFDEITKLGINPTTKKQIKIFEKLYSIISEALPNEKGDTVSHLAPALEMIETNFDSSLNLDMLANACNISLSYLHKEFKKELNLTPFQYITKIRIKKAKILLSEMYPVGEVATMVGYSDIYQFSRAFKKLVGVSPIKYRQTKTLT